MSAVSYVHTPADCREQVDLAAFAATVVERLKENFPPEQLPEQQVCCLAEEAGEFVGAYRRAAGMARRPGPWEDVQLELADVVMAAYVTAIGLNLDLGALEDARDSIGKPITRDAARQVRAVFRAVAEFVEAHDRSVPSTALLITRLAVVINVAYATAEVLGIDLDAAIREKAEKVMSRGWRESTPEASR